MEELWTPWRMPYVVSDKTSEGCIFCSLLDRADHHHFILHRGPAIFVIMNIYPYTAGHLMVIPYRHLARLAELTSEERGELAERLRDAEEILREVLGAGHFHAGINLGRAAGAGVEDHLHAHLVPRGGSPRSPEAGPELSVEEAFLKLRPHFEALG